jgi:putative chitinase
MADTAQAIALIEQGLSMLKLVEPMAAPTPLGIGKPKNASDAFADYGKFYDYLRGNSMLGPKISKDEFSGCDAILTACVRAGWPLPWTAYALATAYHETAHTMQPIHEMGGAAYLTRMYDIKGNRPEKAKELGNLTPGDGAKFGGRGYVQLTGRKNYERATAKLKALGILVDLTVDPDAAMRPDVAAAIMVSGMEEGWFTGRDLADDLPRQAGLATLQQFVLSRDIINGKDRAELIAGYAVDWQTGLRAGGYKMAA